MAELGRRSFLKALGTAVAGAVVAGTGELAEVQRLIWTPRPKGRSMVGWTTDPKMIGSSPSSTIYEVPVYTPTHLGPNPKWKRVSSIIVPRTKEVIDDEVARMFTEMFQRKTHWATERIQLEEETKKWVETGMDRADALAYAQFMLEERRGSVRGGETG